MHTRDPLLILLSTLTLACAACGEDSGDPASGPEDVNNANNTGNNANNTDNNAANNANNANNTGNNANNANNANNTGNNAVNNTGNNAVNNAVNNTGNNATAEPRFVQLIRAAPFPRLVLELDYVGSRRPRDPAKEALRDALEELLDKPGGVEWVEDGAIEPRGDDYAWPFEELDDVADASFDLVVPDDTIKIHILYVDGHAATDDEDTRVLGQAWEHTHLVIYADTIDEVCRRSAPLPTLAEQFCVSAETTILLHEVGHLIGLVDNGLPMQTPHRDAERGRHDIDEGCIMYWAWEGQSLLDGLAERFLAGEQRAPGFDARCLEDIAAVRDE